MLKFAWHHTLDWKHASSTTGYAFNLGAGVVRVVVGCFVAFFCLLFFPVKQTKKRVYIVIKQWPYLGI